MTQARVLMSYHSFRTQDMSEFHHRMTIDGETPDIFGDSGAFSAYSLGAEITLREYAEWLNRWSGCFTTYANLDVIGDHKASMANLAELEARGLRPLPVFHTHTQDLVALEELCERYDYIALGGMVGYDARKIFPWMVKCHKIARKHGTALHGFGQTSMKALLGLPWYSVDSSSWGSGFRYGVVPLFDSRTGKYHKLRIGDAAAWSTHGQLVRDLGFDPQDFIDRDRNTLDLLCQISMIGYHLLERWLIERHGVVHTSFGDGVRVYAADGSGPKLVSGVNGLRLYANRTKFGRTESGSSPANPEVEAWR